MKLVNFKERRLQEAIIIKILSGNLILRNYKFYMGILNLADYDE
jgi:hypothetical protein